MNNHQKVRTRFAPSPTGYIHVGNVRSALYPWLLARQNNGTFIVRIEDTDQTRFVAGATEKILETLNWLGLDWDEGPVKGGPNGPYFQTERKEIYHKWAQKLIDKGLAYADPYTKEEVDTFRQQAKDQKRPFLYRQHRPENPPKWDKKHALRFKLPDIKKYKWHDAVMGDLSAGEDALDDFIIIKADGLPTYNFAHIVDDAEMGITHVIRGAEYVASIPKYLALYEALELKVPVLACLPHIMRPDGKKKLGKRDGAKSVTEYKDEGILPEAMLNFLAGLGWNDGSTQEIFSKEQLIAKFSLDRVQKSGAKFDEKRLLWLNGQWIRQLSLEDLLKRVENFWGEAATTADEIYKKQVLSIIQDRLKTLRDLPTMSNYFFQEPQPDWSLIEVDKNLKSINKTVLTNILQLTIDELSKLASTDFVADILQNSLNGILTQSNQPPKITFSVIRYALTWAPFSPALNDMMTVLGKNITINRLKRALL